MAEVIRMPRLSDTMEEGNIISWLKNEGDPVSPGDILAEVETDKATMDLESFYEGTLLHIGVKEGNVAVDGIIAVIGEKGEDVEAILKEAQASSPSGGGSTEEVAAAPSEAPAEGAPTAANSPTEPAPATPANGRIKASPLAKSMAKENNLDLNGIKGTGEGGRIVKEDIKKAIASGGSSAPSSFVPTVRSSEDVTIPVSQMRKVIAKRLGESKFTAPHFYLTIDINMDRAIEAREAIKALGVHRVSFNDIVVKACAIALRQHPMVNASWTGSTIVQHGEIHVGVAVAVEDGLLVPVIRHADTKPMHIINAEVREMAGRAKNKRLKPEEMQGNTFTISNLGMFGIEEFTAIINPPDSCILAVGSIVEKAIVKNGELAVGNVMKVTLSCDHRVVDGATGAQFLNTLRTYLENPLQMLV